MSVWSNLRTIFSGQPIAVVQPPAPDVASPPPSWMLNTFGPGNPIQPMTDQRQEPEPRTFDYVPSINATISPRIAYGLMSFAQLKLYAETIPELGMCRRLYVSELSGFDPTLKDEDGNIVDIPELKWMTTSPDGELDWDAWLARALYNVIVYDALCLYRIPVTTEPDTTVVVKYDERKGDKLTYKRHANDRLEFILNKKWQQVEKFVPGQRTVGLRIVDGSTIFPVIDEYARRPSPPFPAYCQIIKGMPYKWFRSDQLWYQPRQLRTDSPYGLTAIEDSLRAVSVLDNWWTWINSFYTEGNMPEQMYSAPPQYTYEQVLVWEAAYNAAAAGNPNAIGPRRVKFLPDGFQKIGDAKDAQFHEQDYEKAFDAVSLAHGIPPSEWGDAPGEGLGGKGFAEGGESAFFRMGIEPHKSFIESAFNRILQELGYQDDEKVGKVRKLADGKVKVIQVNQGLHFELSAPDSGSDPQMELDGALKIFAGGIARRNEARSKAGLDPIEGEEGEMIITPSQGQQPGIPMESHSVNGKIPVTNPIAVTETVSVANPVAVNNPIAIKAYHPDDNAWERYKASTREEELQKHCGVCPEDDSLFGAPVSRSLPLAFPKKSTNNLEIVAISDESLGTRPAIWRPESGASPEQRQWVNGDLYKRDEAVYLLDRAMELYLVPITYATEIDGQPGAITHYVKGRGIAKDASEYDLAWIEKAGILDYISNQTDRIAKNWLTHPDEPNRPILIDNALSFCGRPMRSPFVDHILKSGISKDGLDRLYLLCGREDIWADLAELVGVEMAGQARQRAQGLLECTMEAING